MILKLYDGPMDGAIYTLSRAHDVRQTNRKPDGLWFDGTDEHGRNVREEYAFDRLAPDGDHVTMCYRYVGQNVETGIEMETQERPINDPTGASGTA